MSGMSLKAINIEQVLSQRPLLPFSVIVFLSRPSRAAPWFKSHTFFGTLRFRQVKSGGRLYKSPAILLFVYFVY